MTGSTVFTGMQSRSAEDLAAVSLTGLIGIQMEFCKMYFGQKTYRKLGNTCTSNAAKGWHLHRQCKSKHTPATALHKHVASKQTPYSDHTWKTK